MRERRKKREKERKRKKKERGRKREGRKDYHLFASRYMKWRDTVCF